jgi:hypothetical protein
MMMNRARTYHGVSIGILMVRTRFRRFPGDIGHAGTWPFPVQYKIVEEATPQRMTRIHERSLLEPFKRAAQELIDGGIDGIATSCGFLAHYQQELADWSPVPVAASSLLQYPMATRLIASGKRVGILSFDGDALQGAYLQSTGIPADTPVAGMPPDSEFVRAILEDDDSVSFSKLRDEVLAVAGDFRKRHPDIGALLLECTNLAPFSADINEALGLPVFDVVSLVNWFHAGLKPRRFR